MARFLDRAPDIACFLRNAGPEALRIDFQTYAGRLSHYTPDFIVKRNNGNYVMLETKGRVDIDVPLKIRAADAWCKAASESGIKWEYLYVPQEIFPQVSDPRLEMLFPLCEPTKQNLIKEKIDALLSLEKGNLEKIELGEFIQETDFNQLPTKSKKSIQEAIALFKFLEKKCDVSYAAVFTPLLGSVDEAAKTYIIATLRGSIPEDPKKRERFFEPDLSVLNPREESFHKRQGTNLRSTLLENNGVMPMGLLKWCLEYAKSPKTPPGGIFSAVKANFEDAAKTGLLDLVDKIYSFRNEYIAHQEKELSDKDAARQAMCDWILALKQILRT